MVSLLSGMGFDLLSVSRQYTRIKGIGLSSSARQLTNSYLNSAASGLNNLLSAGADNLYTTDAMMTKILAIRASKNPNDVANYLNDDVTTPEAGEETEDGVDITV